MKFILASGNPHKAEELNQLFEKSAVEIVAAERKLDVVEDGETFHANAQKKAEEYYKVFKAPIVSDDSGLVVEALPEELGIHSARFGGEGLSDKQRAELLLEKMQNATSRNAYFICLLCFYFSPDEIYFFEGRLDGSIGHKYTGEHGFGYDPVFIPEKFTESQETIAMHPDWKKSHSHRSLAASLALDFFKNFKS